MPQPTEPKPLMTLEEASQRASVSKVVRPETTTANISTDDFASAVGEYNVTPSSSGEAMLRERAENQSTTEQTLNGLGRLVKVVPSVIQNFSTLADLDAIGDQEKHDYTSNALYNMMQDWKDNVDEALPIYEENPGESFAFGDSGWWLKNISGVAESAGAFVLSSYMTGAVLGKVLQAAAKGSKAILALPKGQQAIALRYAEMLGPKAATLIDGTGSVANTYLATHMEGFGVALETAKASKNIALQQGKTIEEADRIASESAALAYNINLFNFGLNASSAGALFKAPGHTKKLMDKVTGLTMLKQMGIEGVQEGIEEEVNHIAQKVGEAHAKGTKYGGKELLNDALSSEGLESAFWGAFGGIAQTGGSNVVNSKTIKANNKKYIQQQEVQDAYKGMAAVLGNGDPQTALRAGVALNELIDDKTEAEKEGDLETVKILDEKIVDLMAYHAFTNGTTEKLLEMYENVASERGEFKDKFQQAKERINKLEDIYLRTGVKLNAQELFVNRANADSLTSRLQNTKGKTVAKQAELNNKVLEKQKSGEIPSSFTLTEEVEVIDAPAGGKAIPFDKTKESEYQIIINPENFTVTNDNIPTDIKESVESQIQNLPEYEEYQNSITEQRFQTTQLENLEEDYKILNSPEEAARLNELKKLQEEEAKVRKKAEEKEAKAKIEKEKRKDLSKIAQEELDQKEESVEPKAEETTPETQPTSEPTIEAPTEDEPFRGDLKQEPPVGELALPYAIRKKKGLSQEQIDKEMMAEYPTTYPLFLEQLKAKEEAAKAPTRSVIDNVNREVATEISEFPTPDKELKGEDLGEKATEDLSKTEVVTQDNQVVLSDDKRITYAPDALAYLSRDFISTSTVKDGYVKVNKSDINDDMLATYDTDLATTVKVGDEVRVEIIDDNDIEMTHPDTGEKSTWGVVKVKYPDAYLIGVFIGNNTIPSAFIHDESWITKDHVKGDVEQQKKDLAAFREALIEAKKSVVKVTEVGDGVLIKTFDGSNNPLIETMTKAKIGFVKNGAIYEDRDKNPIEDTILNKEVLSTSGTPVVIVPLKSGSVAYPVQREKLRPEYVTSITDAIRLWWKLQNNIELSNEENNLVNSLNINLLESEELFRYIKRLTYISNVTDGDDLLNKVSNLKSNTYLLGRGAGDVILWARGTQTKYEHFIRPGTKPEVIEHALNSLKAHLANSYVNVDGNVSQNSKVKIPLISNKGTSVSYFEGTQKEFIQNNLSSNLLSFKGKNDKTVYAIQNVIRLDLPKKKEEKTPEQNVTPEFTKTTGDYILTQKNIKGGTINQTVKNKETGAEIIKAIKPDGAIFYFLIGEFKGLPKTMKGLASSQEEINTVLTQLGVDARKFLGVTPKVEQAKPKQPSKQESNVTTESTSKPPRKSRQKKNVPKDLGKEVKKDVKQKPNVGGDPNAEFMVPDSDEFEIVRDEFIIRGLSVGQHNHLVEHIVGEITENVVMNKTAKHSLQAHLDSFYNWINDTADYHDSQGVDITILDNLLDNWDDVEKHVKEELQRVKTINVSEEIVSNDQAGSDLEKKLTADVDATLKVDSKKTASAKLKRHFVGIKDIDTDGNEVTGWMGMGRIVPYDTVFNTLLGELAGSKPDFKEQMKKLDNASKGNPWLKNVIKRIEQSDSDVKAEFTSHFSQHIVDMWSVNWTIDKKTGRMTLENNPTNANTRGRAIQRTWINDGQNDLFVVDPNDETEYTINEEKAKKLIEEYSNLPSLDQTHARAWLSDLGINLGDDAWKHFTDNGVYYSNRQAAYNPNDNVFKFAKEALEKALTSPEYSSFDSFKQLYTESATTALAVLEGTYNPYIFTSSFRNGEGNSITGFAANKYLINRVRDLKHEKTLVKNLLKIPFSKHSQLAKDLNDTFGEYNRYGANKFSVFYFDTLGEKDKTGRGVTANSMTKTEQLITRLGLFQNRGTANSAGERHIRMLFPTTSDKKTMYGINMKGYNIDLRRDGLHESTINEVFNRVALPEIERILAVQLNKGRYNIKGYEQGGSQFLMMPELNGLPIFNEDGELFNDILSDEESLNLIKDKVREYITADVEKTLATWKTLGIGDKTNGDYAFMDASYMKGKTLEYAANDFVVNTLLSNSEFFMTIIGDPAVFFKPSKGTKKALEIAKKGNKEDVDVFIQASKDTFLNIGKRLAGDVAPGTELMGAYDNTYRQGFIEDRISKSVEYEYYAKTLDNATKEQLEEYRKFPLFKDQLAYAKRHFPISAEYHDIEGTDAQEYTTLKEHLYVLKGLGKLSSEMYDTLVARWDKDSDNFILSKDELEDVLQPMKPVYVANKIEEIDGYPMVDGRIYIKSSSFPLIPQFTKGSPLEKLRKAMENQGIDRVAYPTATKVGLPTEHTVKDSDGTERVVNGVIEPWLENGDLDINEEMLFNSSKILDRSGFRIQQEVPYKESKSEVNDGTQQRVLLFSNLLDVGGFSYEGDFTETIYDKATTEQLEQKEQELTTLLDKYKYELFPGVYANEGQTQAIDELLDFMKPTNTEKVFTLQGRGGTGKTTIIQQVVNRLKMPTIYLAPTHKAKNVLSDSVGKKAFTLDSALGRRLNERTGKFEVDDYLKKQGLPVERKKLIIVDEASMIRDELFDSLLEEVDPNAKIILMGDNVQLPPVKQTTESKAFEHTKSALTERMRQGEESPILPITDVLAENVESVKPESRAIKDRESKFNEAANEGVVFTNNLNKVTSDFVADFKIEPTSTKIITYNNESHNSSQSVKSLNELIRPKVLGDLGLDASIEYHKGEPLMAYDPYLESGEVVLENSSDYQIEEVGKTQPLTKTFERRTRKGIDTITLTYDVTPLKLRNIISNEIVDVDMPSRKDHQKLKQEIQKLHKSKRSPLAYSIQNSIPNMEYGYAITSHKAQGSTYRNVYVMEDNILGGVNRTNKEKNQSLYVATSRASHKLVMFSDVNTNKNVSPIEPRTVHSKLKQSPIKELETEIDKLKEQAHNTAIKIKSFKTDYTGSELQEIYNEKYKQLFDHSLNQFKEELGIVEEVVEEESEPTQNTIKVDTTKSWSTLKNQPVYSDEGVNTMRTSNKEAPHAHFGNPFTGSGIRSLIQVSTVAQAVQTYKDWLLGKLDITTISRDYRNNVYNAVTQRDWILEQINQGKLDNATLLYDAALAGRGQGSHANALLEVVEKLRGAQPTQPETKEGVSEVFKENTELSKIGDLQQYLEYLDTIFPDSKVKNILYHGSDIKYLQEFSLKYFGQKDVGDRGYGIYLSKNKNIAQDYGEFLYHVLVNIQNPYNVRFKDNDPSYLWNRIEHNNYKQDIENLEKNRNTWIEKVNNNDVGYAFFEQLPKNANKEEQLNFVNDRINKQISDKQERLNELDIISKADGVINEDYEIVTKPEQIHILGSKQDIEGFKAFVDKSKPKTKKVKETKINMEKLQSILIKEAKEMGYPKNDILALELNKDKSDFKLPLWTTMSSDKFEALLNSLVDNKVRKQKRRGNSFVLGSEDGTDITREYESLSEKDKNDIVYVKGFDPTKGLKPQRDGDFAEVMITNKLKDAQGNVIDIKDYLDSDGFIDTTRIDPELLKMFAFRIPTQGLNSMSGVKVVGFLPERMGDLIIAPRDWTKQMGSDFDVDKVFFNMYNATVDTNGELIKLTDDSLRDLQDEYERLTKEIQDQGFTPKDIKDLIGYLQIENEETFDSIVDYRQAVAESDKYVKEFKDVLKKKYDKMTLNNEGISLLYRTAYLHKAVKKDLPKQKIQNDILNIQLAVMANPNKKVQAQRTTPLAFGWFKDGSTPDISPERLNLADTMEKAKEESKGKNIGKFSPLSSEYQMTKYMNATAGQSGVAVFSLDSTFNAMIQGKNVSYQYGDLESEIRFGKEVFKGDFSDPYVLRKDGVRRYKSDVIASYQSAAVDNEKEQILDKININSQTFDVIRALNQMGFEEDTVAAFINQPIIIDYITKLASLQDSTSGYVAEADLQAMTEVLKTYPKETSAEEDVLYALKADAGYQTMMDEIRSTSPNPSLQHAYLEKFLRLKTIGRDIKKIQSGINTAASGLGVNLFEVNAKVDQVLALPESKIKNAEKLIGSFVKTTDGTGRPHMRRDGAVRYKITPDTIAGFATVNALFTASDLWSKFFPYKKNHALTDAMFSDITQHLTEEDSTVKLAKRNKDIWKEFKKYFYSTTFTEDPNTERERLFFDRNNNRSLATIVKSIQQQPFYANNPFISRLETVIHQGNRPSFVKYNAAAAENEVEKGLYAGFIDLVTKPRDISEDYTTKDLADDLVKAAFLEGGIQEAIQYVRYVPMPYLKGTFMEKLNAINWKSDELIGGTGGYYNPNTFTLQYFQHNPSKAIGVEKTDLIGSFGKVIVPNAGFVGKNYLPNEKGDKVIPPMFLSTYDKSSLKKHRLYVYSPVTKNGKSIGQYKQIDTLGGYGMQQYTVGQEAPSLSGPINTKRSFVQPPVSEGPNKIPAKYKKKATDYGSNLTEVLETIKGEGSTVYYRALASEYLKLVKDRGIKFKYSGKILRPDGSPSEGAFYSKENLININPSMSTTRFELVFMHELTHALTSYAVKNVPGARGKINTLINTLKIKINNGSVIVPKDQQTNMKYIVAPGNDAAQEFTAIAMSDPGFQDFLKGIEYKTSNDTFWDKLAKAWGDILKLLGVKDSNNLLSHTLNEILDVVNEKGVDANESTDHYGNIEEIENGSFTKEEVSLSLDPLINAGIINPANVGRILKNQKNC